MLRYALVCLDFAFHLLSSVTSFSWRHLYLTFAHVQTIGYIGCLFPGVYISHMYDLVLSFLFTTAACIFQLCAIMTIILQNCNTAKGVSQHNNNILVCLFQTHKIGTAYIIMSVRRARPTHRNTKFQYMTINLTYCTQE